jgi:hypothetical protein
MQASEARADFWLRAEAKGGGGALREARSSRLVARGSMLQQREVVHCCCACPHALAPGALGRQKGVQKRHPKRAERRARAQPLGAQLPKKGCQPS